MTMNAHQAGHEQVPHLPLRWRLPRLSASPLPPRGWGPERKQALVENRSQRQGGGL